MTRDLVLIGAGHTHLHVVRQWRMQPISGVQLTLISPFSRATYSGMLPGTLAGLYQPSEMEIDLYRFTAGTGIRLIVAPASGLQPASRLITFADRAPLRFDVASVGIGSVPSRGDLWRSLPQVLSIKPMATFLDRLKSVVNPYRNNRRPVRCVVVGGGAAGTEVAFCLDQWLVREGFKHQVTLLDSHPEILSGYVPGLIRQARSLLAARGILVQLGQRVTEITAMDEPASGPPPNGDSPEGGHSAARLTLADGTRLSADVIIWATSASPPAVLENFQLPKTDGGFLAVRSTLQTTADAPVFAVGDTASFVDQRVPKAGVYAVREGPVLWTNLQNMFAGRPLTPYQPQRGFLSLLSTGDRRALLQYQGWTQYGQWAWWLKDRIDRQFMQLYQDYRPPANARKSRSDVPPMQCGGCGSKIGPRLLETVLRGLREHFPEATKALAAPDDAHVLTSAVQFPDLVSVDVLRHFLDDPYAMGRITAVHALSDLWAMGATAVGVQSSVTLPYGGAVWQGELLFQLLAGALRELTIAGVELWGGHTIEGPDLQLGFSVAGQLSGRDPWRKSGLVPGDVLVLTKRLGTGTLLAAQQRGLCRGVWMDELLADMLLSNQRASEVGRDFPIHAATDITGFGLGGHLLEMLSNSNCQVTLSAGALRQLMLPGFRELADAGLESKLAPANREFIQSALAGSSDWQCVELAALVDPQTSGGLLFGVPADRSADLVAALHAAGSVHAVQVGEVRLKGQGGTPRVIRAE